VDGYVWCQIMRVPVMGFDLTKSMDIDLTKSMDIDLTKSMDRLSVPKRYIERQWP
jgi:hypothetical protein